MIQIASPGLMHVTGCSGVVHWDDPEGWDGREVGKGFRVGKHVHPRLIHVNVWQKPLQYCKLIKPQLNFFFFKARHALSLVSFSFPSHFNAYC